MLKIWKRKWETESTNIRSQVDAMGDMDGDAPSVEEATPSEPSVSRLASDVASKPIETIERPKKKRKSTRRIDEMVTGYPQESIILYDSVSTERLDSLSSLITKRTKHHPSLGSFARLSQRMCEELGPCASDVSWKRSFGDIDMDIPLYGHTDDLALLARRKARDTINSWTFAMPNLNIFTIGFNVSPKFLRFVQVLKACEPVGRDFRAVIFVSDKLLARALVDLIRVTEGLEAFRCHILVGNESSAAQGELFDAFISDKYNMLIATSETEDLDIPKASLVVRFSLPNGYLSHAYTYRRTQGAQSHVVLMAEREKSAQRHTLGLLSTMSDEFKAWGLDDAPSTFPPSSSAQLKPFGVPLCSVSSESYMTEPVTGVRVYIADATLLAYRFGLERRERSLTRPLDHLRLEYQISHAASESGFVCRITLPGLLTGSFEGKASASKPLARREACYTMCSRLIEAGLMDHRLVVFAAGLGSTPPIMPPLSEKIAATREYEVKRPSFWRNYCYTSTRMLYPTVICAGSLNADGRRYAPLIIFTRDALSDLPAVKLYFGGVADMIPLLHASPLMLDDHHLHLLAKYTVRAFRLTTNKRETSSLEQMSYFLAPLVQTWEAPMATSTYPSKLPDIAGDICWKSVNIASEQWCVPMKFGPEDVVRAEIADAVVQDRLGEFTRRYDNLHLRPDLTPLSKPKDRQVPGDSVNESLLDYLRAHSTTFQGLKDEKQCIVQVQANTNWFEHLNPDFIPPPEKNKPKYLIPEVTSKCTIPASVFRTIFLLPSIIQRIDELLLVKELNAKLFAHAISEELLLTATTSPSVGYEYDYERLEFLGDSFLKYTSTAYIFVTHPEGVLHNLRIDLISNASLLSRVVRIGLPQYIHAKAPLLKVWCPPNFVAEVAKNEKSDMVPSEPHPELQTGDAPPTADNAAPRQKGTTRRKKAKKKAQNMWLASTTQWLGDKNVADVAEAIIGAAYLTGDRELGLQVIKNLGVPLDGMSRWSDLARRAVMPSLQVSATLRPGSQQEVEKILGYQFKKSHLLAQALTHVSHRGASYERLEFLGDAVLDLLVSKNIFQDDDSYTPAALSVLRAAMVSNSALAAICVHSGLHRHIIFESAELSISFSNYEKNVRQKQSEEYAAATREGRTPGQYWYDIEPPKALADIVESVLAAAYVTENFNTANGPDLIYTHFLKPFYDRHISLQNLANHPTKIVLERIHTMGCRAVEVVKNQSGQVHHCSVVIHGKAIGVGEDRNPAVASRAASVSALEALNKDRQFLSRMCRCADGAN